jgi:hypothetical protein
VDDYGSRFFLYVHLDELPNRAALIKDHCAQVDANVAKLEAYAAATGNTLAKKTAS